MSEMRFATWVRRNRTRQGWTQLELALKVGVDTGSVSRWERGTSEPDVTTFRRLCRIFKADAHAALGLPEVVKA